MATKLMIKSDWCKGCGYCVKACPRDALSLGRETNLAGYNYVVCDHEKCIQCGMCYTACPDYVFTIEEEGGAK
ncbi:MAG: 4Fe-4S binding protein [Clostridia bacterium]|nr:4Fe-4S binding protein [Clostridia bacterium]